MQIFIMTVDLKKKPGGFLRKKELSHTALALFVTGIPNVIKELSGWAVAFAHTSPRCIYHTGLSVGRKDPMLLVIVFVSDEELLH